MFTFKHTGLALKDKNEQLRNFGESLRRFGSPLCPDPKNWMEAFSQLRILIETSKSKGKNFKFIKKFGTSDNEFWTLQLDTPLHNAWAGYAFEQFCLMHINIIAQALGISGVIHKVSCWQSQKSDDGAQIDLVITRADNVVNICEMKFWGSKYTITKKYHAELMHKKETFKTETNCQQAIHLVMITTYGLVQNEYSSIAQQDIAMVKWL